MNSVVAVLTVFAASLIAGIVVAAVIKGNHPILLLVLVGPLNVLAAALYAVVLCRRRDKAGVRSQARILRAEGALAWPRGTNNMLPIAVSGGLTVSNEVGEPFLDEKVVFLSLDSFGAQTAHRTLLSAAPQ